MKNVFRDRGIVRGCVSVFCSPPVLALPTLLLWINSSGGQTLPEIDCARARGCGGQQSQEDGRTTEKLLWRIQRKEDEEQHRLDEAERMANEAQRFAEEAERRANEAQRIADKARLEAGEARRIADEAQHGAEIARREAEEKYRRIHGDGNEREKGEEQRRLRDEKEKDRLVKIFTERERLAVGDPDEILLFVNEANEAPNARLSAQGRRTFQNGLAVVCTVGPWTDEPAVLLAVEGAMAHHGVSRLLGDNKMTACPKTGRMYDVVAVERRFFQVKMNDNLYELLVEIVERRLASMVPGVMSADITAARERLR